MKTVYTILCSFLLVALFQTSAQAETSLDNLTGEWSGTYTCENGTSYISIGNLIEMEGTFIWRGGLMTGNTGKFLPLSHAFYSAKLAKSDQLLLNFAGWLHKPDWAKESSEAAQIFSVSNNGSHLFADWNDCTINLDKRSQNAISASQIPSQIRGTRFKIIGFKRNPTMILFADVFGVFLHLRDTKKGYDCFYQIFEDGNAFKRVPVHSRSDCSEGRISFAEKSGRWGVNYTNPKGDIIFVDLPPDKKYGKAIVGMLTTITKRKEQEAAVAAAQTAEADTSSAFAGLNWDIKGFTLGLDIRTTVMAVNPEHRFTTTNWGVRKEIPGRTELREQHLGVTDIHGVSDKIVITPTHWHYGELVYRITRSVSSSRQELMPSVDALLRAIKKKYGNQVRDSVDTQLRSFIGYHTSYKLTFPIKDGGVSSIRCFDRTLPSLWALRTPDSERLSLARNRVSQIESGSYCQGMLSVSYDKFRSNPDRVRGYSVIAHDFLMEAKNYIADVELKQKMSDDFEANIPENEPEL